MPLIVRWPGVVKPGTRIPQLVQNIDYAPTFMEIAGQSAPAGVQGRSLVPLLRGEVPADWRRSVYYHYYDPGHGVQKHYGIRTGRYTLACFYPVNEWELFDLEKDPEEMNNLYGDPSYAGEREALKDRLRGLIREFEDPVELPQLRGSTNADHFTPCAQIANW